MMSIYRDPVDTFSPIYSLLPIGTERFVAGGARHSILKIFDLRIPGTRPYHAATLGPLTSQGDGVQTQSPSKANLSRPDYRHSVEKQRRGWNIFIKLNRRTSRESPVYSLSRPSQNSTSFFAGIENNVVQFDMTSILDRHPDPIYQRPPGLRPNYNFTQSIWDPHRENIPMSVYEHDTGPVQLISQQTLYSPHGFPRAGWDERWDFEQFRK